MNKKVRKRLLVGAGLLAMVVLMAGCAENQPITKNSPGIWDHWVVYNFSQFIIWLSNIFGNNPGVAIIVFTLIIRIVLLPLTIVQSRSMIKTQQLQPKLQALQKKYSSRDIDTQQKLQTEMQKLYSEAGINPLASFLPLLIQMPFLLGLYQAIYRTPVLQHGTFLWMQLGKPDPYFVMAILAALFTLLTSYLSMLGQPKSSANVVMLVIMPIFIFFTAQSIASAVSIYWVVTNAFSAVQTLFIMKPFKRRREQLEAEEHERAHKKALAKAKKKYLHHK